MQAAFVQGARHLFLQEVPLPIIGPSDVLVRVMAAGICGSDLHFHRTDKMNVAPCMAGGHEFSGLVVDRGTHTQIDLAGCRVAIEPIIGCRRCATCYQGNTHLCRQRRHLALGFAEYALIPQSQIHLLPASLSYEQGAMVDIVAVGIHALRRYTPTLRERGAIVGDGPLALILLQLLNATHLRSIDVVGHHTHTLALAKEWGATSTVNCREVPLELWIDEQLERQCRDVVYECAGGSQTTFEQAIQLLRPGGTLVVLGSFPPPTMVNAKRLLLHEITILFCFSYSTWGGLSEYALALDYVQDHRIILDRLITHRFQLADIQAAFDTALQKESTIKVMITERGESHA